VRSQAIVDVIRRGLIGVTLLVALLLTAPHVTAQPARGIQVGYCGSLKDVDAAKAAGFDYIELGTTEIAGLSDEAFDEAARRVAQSGLPVPVTNLFLPGNLKVTGPAVDPAAQLAYMKKVFPRLQRLGVHILVFGSGGSRRVPDGFPKDQAFAQLVDFGRRAATLARTFDITIALEPLRRQESNIINSAVEGFALVNAINDPNFQMIVDFYHLASEHEDPSIIEEAKDHIRHLHMANPTGRVFPLDWSEFDYAPFFAALRAIAYEDRPNAIDRGISIEAHANDFAHDAPIAIALMRRAFAGDVPAAATAPATGRAGAPVQAVAASAAAQAGGGRGGRGAGGRGAARGAPAGARAQGSVGPRPNVGPADRPVVDPAAVDRGRHVWSVECITCHGASARGTDSAPSLIQSTLVLHDRAGDQLGPFLAKGHPTQSGRPSAQISEAEVRDVMQFLRDRVNDTLRGSSSFKPQDIVTGHADAGRAFFDGAGGCTACHSATGDLAGIGGRVPSPVDLQQRMLFPSPARGRGRGRGRAAAGPDRTAITVTLTPKRGAVMTGTLVDQDDFFVTYRDADDVTHVVSRASLANVVVTDPLAAHHALLDRITDQQIHDLVAYLVTLS
jgi:sugar phosphate isomerase/epimerase/mono/diheme cytochrome c family protein